MREKQLKENLWQHYCSFLDKDFKSQVLWNEDYMQGYLNDFKKTKMAGHLCPGGVKSLEDVPLTTHADYSIMHEFGAEMQELTKRIPRKKGEDYASYYDKLSRKMIKMIDGWMADTYSICVKTSGTSGDSKWFIHGETFWKNLVNAAMSVIIICCSSEPGTTALHKGDVILGFSAPVPYLSGYMAKALGMEGVRMIPPVEITDEIPSFKKKMQLAFKHFKQTDKIDIVGGSGSILKLLTLFFVNRKELFKGSYETANPGIRKIILWLLWKYEQAFGKKLNKLKDIINPKGLLLGSFDTELYLDYIQEQLEMEPGNLFGATELGFPLYGRPVNKSALFPDLRTGYFEFLDKYNNIRKIEELEKGKNYELIFTPFKSIVVRYKTGDIFRLAGFQADGLPFFNFESRVINIIDIHNYFRLSLSTAFKALKLAGFPPSNNWAFTKELGPKERLVLLMENEWGLTEKQVANKLFQALKIVDHEFHNYINDFKISNPEDVISVQYLRRGAFRRYVDIKMKQGVPFGRIKPFRIITPENFDIIKILRSA